MIHRAIVAARLPRWVGRWRDAAVVFSYHNVIAGAAARGERVLHVPREQFRAQLERVTQRFQIIAVDDLLRRQREGRSLRGLAAITFDDAYRGVLRNALPILAEFGVPATIFVITGALDRGEPFWWDRVADQFGGKIPGRDQLLTEMAGEETRILTSQPSAAQGEWDDEYFPATDEELAALDRHAVAFGPHTVTHPNLTRVALARAREEIDASWRTVQERFANSVAVTAYPYGAVNDDVSALARETGLVGFGGAREPLTRGGLPGSLPRLFVGPNTSPDALEVTTARLLLR